MDLKPVSYLERHMSGLDYFILWFGASISIAEMYAGNILVPLGWTMGLAAILIGHAVGNVPFALGGLLGSEQGLPTMYLLRGVLGRKGSYAATILNILQLVGWTAIMIIICAKTIGHLIPEDKFGSYALWIIFSGVVCTVWAMVGKSTFKWLQRLSIATLGSLCVVMTVMLFLDARDMDLSAFKPTGGLDFGVGLDLCIVMPISWLPLVADYSRFARSGKTSFWGTYVGYFLGSSWMFALGLASGLILDKPDPILSFATFWFGVPALIIVLFSTFTTTFLDIYSSAVSAMNLNPKARMAVLICITGVFSIAVGLLLPMEEYMSFLLLIGSFFIPLFGIVLTQYFLLQYDRHSRKTVDWIAIGLWALGVVLYQTFHRTGFFLGASLPTLLGTGLIFYLVKRMVGLGRS